jgi:hypothetical protein
MLNVRQYTNGDRQIVVITLPHSVSQALYDPTRDPRDDHDPTLLWDAPQSQRAVPGLTQRGQRLVQALATGMFSVRRGHPRGHNPHRLYIRVSSRRVDDVRFKRDTLNLERRVLTVLGDLLQAHAESPLSTKGPRAHLPGDPPTQLFSSD